MAKLIDEMQISFSPALLGEGENLFAGIDFVKLGYGQARAIRGEKAMHIAIHRT
jgi:dihydrofolate reductase